MKATKISLLLAPILASTAVACAPAPTPRVSEARAIRCPETTHWDGEFCAGMIACPANTSWNGEQCAGALEQGRSERAAPETTTAEPSGEESGSLHGTRVGELEEPALGRIDIFLQSDVEGGWSSIDGFPAPAPPGKTFVLDPGDHVVEIGAPGHASCRFTLRGLKAGQSVTVKALLKSDDPRGCGLVARRNRLGEMASF